MLLATCGGHYIYSNDWLGKITLKISYIILTYIIKERMPISLRLVGWLVGYLQVKITIQECSDWRFYLC